MRFLSVPTLGSKERTSFEKPSTRKGQNEFPPRKPLEERGGGERTKLHLLSRKSFCYPKLRKKKGGGERKFPAVV